MIVAAFPAVKYGQLHYRTMEKDRLLALNIHNWNFDKKVELSLQSKNYIHWCLTNITDSRKSIVTQKPDIQMF